MSLVKTRVLIVDDAVVIRRLLVEALSDDPELEVAGWASNGKIAMAQIAQLSPDCVTLDLEMPEMDGLETLSAIRKLYPNLPVIMFSTLTEHGAVKTLEALARGASDYVTKPANVGSVTQTIARLREDLLPRIKAVSRRARAGLPLRAPKNFGASPAAEVPNPLAVRSDAKRRTGAWECEVFCIAASTGGPNAVSALLAELPGDFPVPILITQHMPPVFTAVFANRLNDNSALRACEGKDGQKVQPGCAYVAPGGKHMTVERRAGAVYLKLTEDPPENSCRPAADVMLRSAVRTYGKSILALVLTGMGQDGLKGCREIRDAGGRVLAQDEASSVVWGMPGAVAKEGLAEQVLPLEQIASAVVHRCVTRRHALLT